MQAIFVLRYQRLQMIGIFKCRFGIVNRTRSNDYKQTMIFIVQYIFNRLPRMIDALRHGFLNRQTTR